MNDLLNDFVIGKANTFKHSFINLRLIMSGPQNFELLVADAESIAFCGETFMEDCVKDVNLVRSTFFI